jgi:hypothetical protein
MNNSGSGKPGRCDTNMEDSYQDGHRIIFQSLNAYTIYLRV